MAIGGALYCFFKWQPVHKPWCVILYHVSRETNARFDWPNPGSVNGVNALDEKLDQVVGVLEQPAMRECADLCEIETPGRVGCAASEWTGRTSTSSIAPCGTTRRSDLPGKQARARIVTWRPDAPCRA